MAHKIKAAIEHDLTKPESRRLLESISDDIRKYTDLIGPLQSRAAKELAGKKNINLLNMRWHDQPKFDRGRSIFHFEHVFTVRQVRDLCMKCTTPESIADVLESKTKVAWILKREDDELTRLGFKFNRPDPALAYAKAGIQIMN